MNFKKNGMLHISLFSGIGGFDLASEWMGWQNIVSCEINPFGKRILEYYWPEAYHHDDIKTLTIEKINHELEKKYGKDWRADDIVLSGGFPCQPYSTAGKRLGKNDDRHLWPEMLRVIREVRPKWIVGENVRGLTSWNEGVVFDEVQSDLEAEGYEVQSFILPAASVGAPHRRDRVWIVAYTNDPRRSAGFGQVQRADGEVSERNHNGEFSNAGDGYASNATSERFCADCSKKKFQPQAHRTRQRMGEQVASNAESTRRKGECVCESRKVQFNGCCIGNVPNPNNSGLQGWENESNDGGEKRKGKQCNNTSGCFCSDFRNFPTQSPICGGDDGLPTELDGVTFSKWRNESIKAYGNAVVPQLVFRIFQAIEAYEIQVHGNICDRV